MAATAASRSERSTAPGVSKGTCAAAMRALARVMRCSMALSPTRKARAICFTDRPETMRSASAICWVGRQVRMAADEQQPQDVVAVVGAVEPLGQRRLGVLEVGQDAAPPAAARCFAWRRTASIAALRPTKISQAAGSRGGPFCGQFFSARRQASWKASSAVSRSRK